MVKGKKAKPITDKQQETRGEDQNGLGWQLKKSEVTQLHSLLGMRKNSLAVTEQVGEV